MYNHSFRDGKVLEIFSPRKKSDLIKQTNKQKVTLCTNINFMGLKSLLKVILEPCLGQDAGVVSVIGHYHR